MDDIRKAKSETQGFGLSLLLCYYVRGRLRARFVSPIIITSAIYIYLSESSLVIWWLISSSPDQQILWMEFHISLWLASTSPTFCMQLDQTRLLVDHAYGPCPTPLSWVAPPTCIAVVSHAGLPSPKAACHPHQINCHQWIVTSAFLVCPKFTSYLIESLDTCIEY